MICCHSLAIGLDREGRRPAGGDERIPALERSILGESPKILENSLAARACSKMAALVLQLRGVERHCVAPRCR